VLIPLGYLWQDSRLPDSYSVMEMGTPDFGGGPQSGHLHHATSVSRLVNDPSRKPDVLIELQAARRAGHYTLNGTTPGPTIRAQRGQLIEVRLTNKNIAEGVTLHWHGVDVPNAEDGVAGVTQNAVLPTASFTYRFVAEDAGTFWYHSHQVSHEQVRQGLFGALVIERPGSVSADAVVVAHTYDSVRTINGRPADLRLAGHPRRLRVVNTDNSTLDIWSSAAFRIAAIDGRDIASPGTVRGQRLRLAAGGRADLEVIGAQARVQIGAETAVLLGDAPAKAAQPAEVVDLMSYGSGSQPQSLGAPDRTFKYAIGRRPGFLDGQPGFWWTVNSHMGADVPMFMVREGEVVAFHLKNNSGEDHPMHLHGHHALVTRFNDENSVGSPIWVDSLDLEPGDSATIVFRADNPGIWLDHCHNLSHADEGLLAHLMYEGVTTGFRIGGEHANDPE
jgi:FtsP/CotA-like multicopper oxidase with cupredoxin domain